MSPKKRAIDPGETRLLREKLREIDRETGRPFDNETDCCGLTVAQCHTLLEVGSRERVSLMNLAEAFGLDASTLSRTVQGLVLIGLLSREPGERDRRYVVISLTPQGREVFRSIETRFDDYYAGVLERIPAAKRRALLESVALLAEAVRRQSGACCGRGRKR